MTIRCIAPLSGKNRLSPFVYPSGIAQSKSIPPSFDFFFLPPFLPGEVPLPLLEDFFLSPDLSLLASFFLSPAALEADPSSAFYLLAAKRLAMSTAPEPYIPGSGPKAGPLPTVTPTPSSLPPTGASSLVPLNKKVVAALIF